MTFVEIAPSDVPRPTAEGLPIGRLLAFTVAGFLAIMTENMPAGLLPQIGADLGVSQALTGQTVTMYALGSVVAAIPVIAATRRWSRRPLFLLAIAGLLEGYARQLIEEPQARGAVGATMLLAWSSYFALAGRRRGDAAR